MERSVNKDSSKQMTVPQLFLRFLFHSPERQWHAEESMKSQQKNSGTCQPPVGSGFIGFSAVFVFLFHFLWIVRSYPEDETRKRELEREKVRRMKKWKAKNFKTTFFHLLFFFFLLILEIGQLTVDNEEIYNVIDGQQLIGSPTLGNTLTIKPPADNKWIPGRCRYFLCLLISRLG